MGSSVSKSSLTPNMGIALRRSGYGKKIRRKIATARQEVDIKRRGRKIGVTPQTEKMNLMLGSRWGITGRIGAILHKARKQGAAKKR